MTEGGVESFFQMFHRRFFHSVEGECAHNLCRNLSPY